MTGLVWRLNRLRAMGPREVAHRGRRWWAQRREGRRVRAGWAPQPPVVVGPAMSLFAPVPDWREAWSRRYRLNEAALDLLVQGQIGFFGHAPLDVGMPVQWHRCPLTGVEAPRAYGKAIDYRDAERVGNVKFLWELGRHQHLVPLAVGYAVTGQRRYRDAVLAQIEGWIAANPFGMGIHWCSGLEVALRLISWALVHSLLALRDGPRGLFAAVADPRALGRSLYQQAAFVRGFTSRYSSANNHLIGELTGLLVACRVFDFGEQGRAWAAFAHEELEVEAERQVHPDGVDREQAFYYHLWVLEYLLVAWLVEQRAGHGFAQAFATRIDAMARFLDDVTPEGGLPPQVGDADDGMVARFDPAWPVDPYAEVLTAVAAVRNRGATIGIGPPGQKAYWCAMMAGRRLVETPPAVPRAYPRCYPEGGYTVLGGEGLHLVFDAGPLGYPSIAAHGHADALSVCLAVDGQWWLVDPGTYAYHTEHGWRDYFRGTAAHNTLRVDGLDQSTIGGPFLWVRHARASLERCEAGAEGRQVAEGVHDGYRRRGVIHRRRLALEPPGTVRIEDAIEGGGEHDLELHFHFAPEVTLELDGAVCLATRPGAGRGLEAVLDPAWRWEVVRGREEPPLGWYSPALERKVPAPVLKGSRRAAAPLTVVTTFRARPLADGRQVG
ncbi:MAG TPA: alginate lyase family protein [Gammaproteobacteria bacterium]|nr:alginate lyase family protein [Gammaproteobacteria bacterium]